MTQELKVMVGIPASGKSTWIQKETAILESEGKTVCVVSRDEVRKSLLRDSEDYFSHEKKVFNEYVRQLNEAMEIGFDVVIADATHINAQSRKKLLRKLFPDPSTHLVFEVMMIDPKVAIERNSKREGFARVPDDAIYQMTSNFSEPSYMELPFDLYGFNTARINFHEEGE